MVRCESDPRRRWLAGLALLAGVALAPALGSADPRMPRSDETRLGFHLDRAAALRETLAPAVYGPCRRFESPAAWNAHLAWLVDHGITFAAHLIEARHEARLTGDAAVQADFRATRRRLLTGDPVRLVVKFIRCASANGSSLNPWTVWRRASAEFPGRREQVSREADVAVGSSDDSADLD